MNIGNKIKELRKQRGITQEQLANSIGISFQAVSKWENGIALPDITLAPILASYFGVSMDELFEFNLKEIESAIDSIVNEAYKFRESDPPKSKDILEEDTEYMKKSYNNGIELANHFGWTLIHCLDEEGNLKTIEDIHAEIMEIATKFLEEQK